MTIPIPAGMEQATATWRLGHATQGSTLTGARGFVRFVPTAVAVAYEGTTALPRPVETKVVTGVMTPVKLTVNDPELWNWRVEPDVGPTWEPFHIDVPAEGVDLASVVVVPGRGPVRAVTGPPGATAYDLAVAHGYIGTEVEWLASLRTSSINQVTGLRAALDAATPYNGGWRNIAALTDAAVVTTPGVIRLRRYADRLEYDFDGLRMAAASGSAIPWGALPVGYRPTWNQYRRIGNATGQHCEVTVNTGGGIVISGATAGATYRGGFAVYTTAAPPTTHPGAPN